MRRRLEALGVVLALAVPVQTAVAEEPKGPPAESGGKERPGDAASPPARDTGSPGSGDRGDRGGIEKPGKRGTTNTAGPGSSGNTPGPAGTGRTGPGGTDCANSPGGCVGGGKLRRGRPAGR